MVKKLLIVILLVPFIGFSQNQEVATFVTYNTLNYRNPSPPSGCTGTNNSPLDKEGYMKTIFGYIQPDLISCCEVGPNAASAVKILDRCLNVNGETKYVMAPFNYTSGSNLANSFYYNGDMFALKSNDKITKEVGGGNIIRLIDVFYLYYKDANLPSGSDTTFLTVFSAHLKASQGTSEKNERDKATQAIMKYITDEGITGNYIISGDFNTYTSSENAIQNLINPSNTAIQFIDPIDRMGNWNNNSSYADVHTQSTRVVGGCGASGGLDDRFDFILMSQAIENNTNLMEYVNNSYKAVANDGNHFNSAINNPANNSVPASVLDAIYNNSDHLPVVMDMIITEADPNGISDIQKNSFSVNITNPVQENIIGKINGETGNYTITVYSITGSKLRTEHIYSSGEINFEINVNTRGLLLVEVKHENGFKQIFKVVRN